MTPQYVRFRALNAISQLPYIVSQLRVLKTLSNFDHCLRSEIKSVKPAATRDTYRFKTTKTF